MKILFATDLYPVSDNEKTTPRTLYNFVQGFKAAGVEVDIIKPNFILNSFLRKKPFYKSWEKTLNEAKTLIVKAENNFDNKEIVTKKFIKIAKSIRKNSDKIFQNENNTVFLEPLNGVF